MKHSIHGGFFLFSICAIVAFPGFLRPLQTAGAPSGADPSGAAPSGAAPSKDSPGEVIREKTVYIPYEKLQAIFEKEGRGIFLSYEEFLRLWREAQKKPPEPPPDLPPAAAVIRGGTYTGTVSGEVATFEVNFDIEALKEGWSELGLPFQGVAVESAQLSSPRMLFSAKGNHYALFLPAPGNYTAKLKLSAPVAKQPGKKTVSFSIPPVAVSRLELAIPEEGVRVDVQPALAVTQQTAKDGATRVLAFLGNSASVSVSWMPPPGKLAEEGAVLLAEQSIRVSLGERILKISADIDYQVVRGEVDELRVRMPENTRLLSVKGENIREWLQEKEVLVVKLHSALRGSASLSGTKGKEASSYRLELSFERILAETPPELAVPFPRVEGVIRESGWVVFAHESGLNVRFQDTAGLSQMDRDEVPKPLQPSLGVGFRYLAQPLSLNLAVEKITPLIRSLATSVITLGTEEDVWIGWIDFAISRAGVFQLRFQVPERWNVTSVGDQTTVEDFQTTQEGGLRTIAVSLKSKALGTFRLPFKLTAQGSAVEGEKTLSPPVVLGSEQDRGLFGVSAPKAINLSTIQREKMTSADVDELFQSGIMTQVGADTGIPLTYGYREQPASVQVRLEAKKTEIDVLAQHLIEVTDGGIKFTHILDYEILYAAVEQLRFSAPSSLDDILKVEAKEKKEVRKVPDTRDPTIWEITLQAPALGGVSVTLTHELELKALAAGQPNTYPVPLVHPDGVREQNGFVAVRKDSTLEIAPEQTGMEVLDASDLPDKLRRGQIYSAFRYFTPDPTLNLKLTRYEYQALATTIVNLIKMKSVLSEERRLKTQAVLFVQNTERQYLELGLSPEAKIFSISVAGRSQQPRKRKEGAGTLIQIPPSAGPGGTFPVVIVYDEPLREGAMGTFGTVSLGTPEVLEGVPVTKIELELYLAPEFAFLSWGGNMKPRYTGVPGLWSRFKRLVTGVLGAEGAGVPRPERGGPAQQVPAAAAGAVDVEIPTRGYVRHDFETLAPLGALSFSYISRGFFSFLDFLAFLLAAGCGYLFTVRFGWRKLTWAAVLIFIPLVLVWFSQGAIVELFSSLLAGSVLFFLVLLALHLGKKMKECRAARLALAPDPYLEEAAPPKKEEAAPPAPPEKEEAPPEKEGEKKPDEVKPKKKKPEEKKDEGPGKGPEGKEKK